MRISQWMFLRVAAIDSDLVIMYKSSKNAHLSPKHSQDYSVVESGCSEKASPVKGRILLMEEEPSIRSLIERMLTPKGFDVACAIDGAEAVEKYRDAKALQCPFDVVILDLTVTFGMGAEETIKHLLEIDPDVKGIVSSGYSFDDIIVNYSKYGFKGAITKPFSMNELMMTVNKTIENS